MNFNNLHRQIGSPPILSYSANHGIISLSLFLLLLILSPAIPLARAQPGFNTPQINQDPYNRVSPSWAVIIVVLVTAIFFMGFFSIYLRRCTDSSANSSLQVPGVNGRSRRAARGLDPSLIETFPTLEYSVVKGLKIGKGALECAVCLCEFEDDEKLRLIPKCDHVFHPECIDEWLKSHTTCPVCRANLAPESGEAVHEHAEVSSESDIESQNDAVDSVHEDRHDEVDREPVEPQVMCSDRVLTRSRTRGRSNRRKFSRSHSTGHSLIQPGENTERFTLRLPVEVRKQILLNRKLHRATSMVVLRREGSSRRGNRTGGEASSRGKFTKRLESFKSDKWVFSMTPPFLMRASSIKSPRVVTAADEGTSTQPSKPSASNSVRPPV
ncbi:E3 ubiquitin-protein ligase ATL6-like [Quillaja saponaria]|uniref:RING-type E3 ubiquitin transferase n=1 Tax=Quillaja saponaria TaxID=32244 RepID=A0AAD7Q213_QUISA|nr:E3 ubiquitin-protein ligase ATL6-like [Quillaja saponaria]